MNLRPIGLFHLSVCILCYFFHCLSVDTTLWFLDKSDKVATAISSSNFLKYCHLIIYYTFVIVYIYNQLGSAQNFYNEDQCNWPTLSVQLQRLPFLKRKTSPKMQSAATSRNIHKIVNFNADSSSLYRGRIRSYYCCHESAGEELNI